MVVFTPPASFLPFPLTKALFPFLSLSLFFYVSLSLSVAAGRRREDAITAAHEGGWKKEKEKKKHTRQTAPIPSGLSTPIPPNLWRFLTRQTQGKLLQSEDIGVPVPSALPGDLSHSEQSLRSQRVSVQSGLVACMRSIHLNPLTSI